MLHFTHIVTSIHSFISLIINISPFRFHIYFSLQLLRWLTHYMPLVSIAEWSSNDSDDSDEIMTIIIIIIIISISGSSSSKVNDIFIPELTCAGNVQPANVYCDYWTSNGYSAVLVNDNYKKKVKGRYGNPISELRDVTCHMGSHSVTCHPTQVNAHRLTPQPCRLVLDLSTREGWKAELT